MYGLALVGGWVEQFGTFAQNPMAVNRGIVSSLIVPSEALWRRAAYEMTPALVQGMGFAFGGPFVQPSVPSVQRLEYAAVYLLVALALAVRQFERSLRGILHELAFTNVRMKISPSPVGRGPGG